MKAFLLPLAACAISVPAIAQQSDSVPELPDLAMEQQSALRCGVAFALISNGQKADDPEMRQYPQLGERGREFFVRTTARLMDDGGFGRDTVARLVLREVKAFEDNEELLGDVMPACTLLLDASGV